jgi:hypothetical protein
MTVKQLGRVPFEVRLSWHLVCDARMVIDIRDIQICGVKSAPCHLPPAKVGPHSQLLTGQNCRDDHHRRIRYRPYKQTVFYWRC